VYWGTQYSIRLKEYEDNRVINRHKKTLSLGFEYSNVKYEDICDEDSSLLFSPVSSCGGGEDLSLLFPPELGDLSATKSLTSDLQKWETLTKLDKDSNEQLDLQLLQSLIEVTPVKALSRKEHLLRSQSFKFDSGHHKTILSKSSARKQLSHSLLLTQDNLITFPQPANDITDNNADHDNTTTCDNSEQEDLFDNDSDIFASDDLVKDNVANVSVDHLGSDDIGEVNSHTDDNPEENKENVETVRNSGNNLGNTIKPLFQLGTYTPRAAPTIKASFIKQPATSESRGLLEMKSNDKREGEDHDGEELVELRRGPRALRRRKGKRMTRLRRRSSINGHWYDRETAVFTPPKHSAMSVWTSSLCNSMEVMTSLLSKYKIESEAGNFGLYVVKESGETRLITDEEYPLLLRVNLGPHEDIAKVYLMNKDNVNEVSDKVAEFLRFSYAELRSFLNMFYEEEEREADRIRYKYHTMREIILNRIQQLEEKQKQSVLSGSDTEEKPLSQI